MIIVWTMRGRANIMKCGAKQVDYIEIDSRLCYENIFLWYFR